MDLDNKFPLYLPGRNKPENNGLKIVAADIRENFSILNFFITNNGKIEQHAEKMLKTADYQSLPEMLNFFIEEHAIDQVNKIAVAVPGPVIAQKGFSDRLPWVIDQQEIQNGCHVSEVYLINDLEATAYGLADLTDENLIPIHETSEKLNGNVAILAPGNGLGEAGLFFDRKCLRPFATEGGHSEFSPRTNVEVEFYQFLNKIYGIVSWENVLSKSGLYNIYRFLRDEKRHPLSEKFVDRLKQDQEFSKNLFDAAMEDQERIATISMNTYLEFLAREANSLVMKLKATGGLLITGELPLMMKDYIDRERFYQKFLISDKMDRLLKDVPVYIVDANDLISKGAAYYAAFSDE